MKMKRSITKILIAMLVVVLAIGTTSSLAVQVQSETLELTLSYFRKVNGKYTNGYALKEITENHIIQYIKLWMQIIIRIIIV